MYRVKKFKVMKVALFGGLYGVFIGLLFGILTALFSLFASTMPTISLVSGIFSLTTGVFAIIVFPLFYGISAFIGGLIFTPIMNLTLKIVKGIDFELEAIAVRQEAYTPSHHQPEY